MATKKIIEIKSRRRKPIVLLLLMLYFIFELAKLVYQQATNMDGITSLLNIAVNLVLFAVCGCFALFAIKRLSDKGPGLILNKLGIIDNSGFVSAGLIYWTDVEGINTSKIIFSDCILVKVKNPDRYIKNQKSWFKKMWLTQEYHRYGSPINIAVDGLQIKYNDLFGIVQQHFLASHVATRTFEITREKDIIQQEKTALVDSINYAKRIQSALLPSHTTIEQHLGENFVLFLPKDIVSGDFYWVQAVNDWVFFAECDCTGHGVPGALISIVCNNALNRAVKEFGITQPSHILDKVAELIIESIGVDGEVKDGMDASVCAFNKTTREMYWAGANSPLWIARETTFYELLEFKPDKQPIGQVENRFAYTNHQIEIKQGDILYLFSDGYADQFGGDRNKKLTRKKFKELLLQQRNQSLQQQHDNLLSFHTTYKKQQDQIDDILVMGIRVEH